MENLEMVESNLSEQMEIRLARKYGAGVNRAEKSKIEKSISREMKLFHSSFKRFMSNNLDMIKQFDTGSSSEAIQERVDEVYELLEQRKTLTK